MKYIVTGNIKHNGKRLQLGSQIDMDEADAAPLVRDGYLAIVAAGDDKPAVKNKGDDK